MCAWSTSVLHSKESDLELLHREDPEPQGHPLCVGHYLKSVTHQASSNKAKLFSSVTEEVRVSLGKCVFQLFLSKYAS